MRKTIAFALSLLGLFISLYLLWVYASPSHPMVCLGGGCDEVRASTYAHVLGIPTPAYGVVFYALLSILMFVEAAGVSSLYSYRAGADPKQRRAHIVSMRAVVLVLAGIGVAVAVVLTAIEAFVIHAWCAWCAAQAVAITLIFLLWLSVCRTEPVRGRVEAERYWTVLMVAVIVGSGAFYLLQRAARTMPLPPPAAETIAAKLVRPDSHVTGNAQSPVTFVEFGDLQCPACAASYPIVRELRKQFGDRVRFVFRHFPLPTIHVFAMHSAQAAECAAQQGRFWEYVDRVYEAHGDLQDESLQRYAAELGLDRDQFQQCLASGAALTQVQRDQLDGLALGVRSTPTFFVDKRRIEGALTEYQFSTLLLDDLQSAGMLKLGTAATPAPAAGVPPVAEKSGEKKSAPATSGAALSMGGGTSSGGFFNVQGASTDCSADAPKGPEPPQIHLPEAQKKLQEGAVFVDVRSPDDFASGHIQGAVNLPLLEVERRAGELPKDKPIVVYEAGTAASGDVCAAAKSAARVLISRGYKAAVYQDGLKNWEKAGLAVEK